MAYTASTVFSLPSLEAKIQTHISEFLALKDKILTIRKYTESLDLRDRADKLYQDQIQAEEKLKSALVAIDELKAGGWSIEKLGIITTGIAVMEYQFNRYKVLEKAFAPEAGLIPKMGNLAYLALAGLGVFLLIKFIR